jgi:hypothetical protein
LEKLSASATVAIAHRFCEQKRGNDEPKELVRVVKFVHVYRFIFLFASYIIDFRDESTTGENHRVSMTLSRVSELK